MLERAHVVQPVGQLDQDDADVVHHREHHLAEALGLLLLLRVEGDARDLGETLDDVRDVLSEVLLNDLARRQGVLENVVQQPGDDAREIELEVGKDEGDGQGMRQVRLAGRACLSLVLLGREDVGSAQEVEIGPLHVALHLLLDVLEPDHGVHSAPRRPGEGLSGPVARGEHNGHTAIGSTADEAV